jgi:hypothetical protein
MFRREVVPERIDVREDINVDVSGFFNLGCNRSLDVDPLSRRTGVVRITEAVFGYTDLGITDPGLFQDLKLRMVKGDAIVPGNGAKIHRVSRTRWCIQFTDKEEAQEHLDPVPQSGLNHHNDPLPVMTYIPLGEKVLPALEKFLC